MDKDEIRPDDLFAKALEEGLVNNRPVAFIFSPDAIESGWVEVEYYRALSLVQNRRLSVPFIPVILREAELSGFAQNRNWTDFRDEVTYGTSYP